MGDIADDMIEGFSCSTCGIYFQASHGYPVQCKDCKKHCPEPQYQKATEPEAADVRDKSGDNPFVGDLIGG